MALRLPAALLAEIARRAEGAYPAECCGLLLGPVDGVVDEVLAAANLDPAPTRGYFIDPQALLSGHRRARHDGRQVVGYYHSHPDAPAEPSARDRREALPAVSYLIVPLRDGRPGTARSFRAQASPSADGGEAIELREEPVEVLPEVVAR